MAKVAVVRNPVSGRSRLASKWLAIQESLQGMYGNVEYFETAGHGDATSLARGAVQNGAEIVLAVGGDGTITHVANGIIGTGATLGIIPSGTGNDLCRTLGIGTSAEGALEVLATGNTCAIDVGKWTTDEGEGYFLNIAGMGFDAAVADRINRGFRHLHGTSAYLAAVVTTLVRFKARTLTVTVDGKSIQERIMLAAIANAKCYGGGMLVAPMASVTDGMLDVVLVRKLGRLAFLTAFPRVFKGSHISHPAVLHLEGKRIRLEPEDREPFLIDGELTPCRWAEIEVLPGALRVIAP
jgi:diacylglycerol kinase (ATP)